MHLFDRPAAPNPYDALPPTQTFTLESNDLTDGRPLPLLHSAQGGNNGADSLKKQRASLFLVLTQMPRPLQVFGIG